MGNIESLTFQQDEGKLFLVAGLDYDPIFAWHKLASNSTELRQKFLRLQHISAQYFVNQDLGTM
tara:strand:- start:936 stop:1127 length:192 start_codon:yes stop_codon:yes gene_type:complete